MECPDCQTKNYSNIQLVTITTWGHGDSTYESYFQCNNCGYESEHIGGYGLFPENQEWRKPQEEFNK